MDQKPIFEIQAKLCRSMSNPVRIEIIHMLRTGAKCVGEIANLLGQPQTAISRHLSLLSTSGIITSQHQGSNVFYQIANPKIAEICDLMREVLMDETTHRTELIRALGGFDSNS